MRAYHGSSAVNAPKLLFLLTTLLVAARGADYRLEIEVTDPAGKRVAKARVIVSNSLDLVAVAQETDAEGRCRFELPAVGEYRISVAQRGFVTRTQAATVPGKVSISLALSPLQEEITVAAELGQVLSTESVAQRIVVLNAEEIRQRAPTALTESGTGEAGVEQVRTSSTMGSFFVRGLTGKNVGVYRDGIRYTTSAQRGGVSTFQNLVDPSSLNSIEFLRGPSSAQYGSDSVGGTVNLQSRLPEFGASPGRWLGEVAPVYHSATQGGGGNLLIGYSGGRGGFLSNISGRRVNAFRTGGGLDSHAAVTRFLGLPSTVIGDDRLPDSDFTQYGGSFHFQWALNSRVRLAGHYERGQQDGARRYDQLLGGDGNLIADLRNLMMDFGYLRVHRYGLGWFDEGSLSGSYNAQREERINQGGQGNPNGAITNQYERIRVLGAQFQLTKRWRGGHQSLFGGEAYHERMASPAFAFTPATRVFAGSRPRVPDGSTYKIHGLFLQGSWSPPVASGKVRLSGAVRFGGAAYQAPATSFSPPDSLTANALSGRAGAVVHLVEPLLIHASYSRGFRAPSLTDLGTLGIQGNGFFEANYNDVSSRGAHIGTRADDQALDSGLAVERLRPEKTDSYDLGATLRTGVLVVEVTGFWMRLQNTIVSQTMILPQGAAGTQLGDQVITRQLPSGAVFVPIATQPVLVRANFTGARLQGMEQKAAIRITKELSFEENLTYLYSEDAATGLPPDIEPGSPPTMANLRLNWAPVSRRFWVEAYSTIADRQTRISSLSLADRRTGASRSRTNIANFFNNGARVRGLVVNGLVVATGETLAQVQTRVLGTANSAPMFTAIPGWGCVGVRAGVPLGERSDLFADFSNIADKNYRGIGWGLDGAGRSLTLRWRTRF